MTHEPLLLRGPFRSRTGYGLHTRAVARDLLRRGLPLELEDLPAFSRELLAPGDLDPRLETLPAHTAARRVVHLSLPTGSPPRQGCRNVLYTMFEGTRLPAVWAAASRAHDAVVVPSESSADAWRAAGFPTERIHLCPLGVDREAFHPGVEPLPLTCPRGRAVADYRVRVLNVSAVIPRKNLPGLLRVWLRATRADDDAVLVAKLGGLTPDGVTSFMGAVAAVETAASRRFSQAAPIVWLLRALPDAEMPRLFAAASHYVSLSFGEGWDLPMAQAAAMGLRLLAPAHSAYLAYLDEQCARLIPARQVPALGATDPAARAIRALAPWTEQLFADADWWAPDEDAACARLREAIDGPAEAWPVAPQRLARYDWESSVERLLAIVGQGTD